MQALPPRPFPTLGPGLGGPRAIRVRQVPAENATLVSREEVSTTVARFVVRPDTEPAPFLAGQYVALGLQADDGLVQRPYSTASAPGADVHELLVRLVPGGALTPLLWQLAPGSRVSLGPPKGMFTLRPDDSRTHLLVASGTGLAPFVGMIRTLSEARRPPRIVLVHGVARATDLAFRDEIARLARTGLPLAYQPTVSRPDDPESHGWTGRVGRAERVLQAVLAELDISPASAVAYLCGNPGMIGAARATLTAAGMPPTDIHAEEYWAPGSAAPTS